MTVTEETRAVLEVRRELWTFSDAWESRGLEGDEGYEKQTSGIPQIVPFLVFECAERREEERRESMQQYSVFVFCLVNRSAGYLSVYLSEVIMLH
jgi:hypothetical protein